MLVAAKWAHEDKVMSFAAEDLENDLGLVQWCHELLDEADIVIAHNGARFDIPVMNARMIKYKMRPPAPYKVVDTLRAARRVFRFPHNSLAGLSDYLNLRQKKSEQNFSLWRDCLSSSKHPAWADMDEYCRGDLLALEALYYRLLPWVPQHPNVGLFVDTEKPTCTSCGGTRLQRRGTYPTRTHIYPRFMCTSCGRWGRGRGTIMPRAMAPGVLTDVAVM